MKLCVPNSDNVIQLFDFKVALQFICSGRIYEFANGWIALLGPVYTWRTLTGVKLNTNCTQYSCPESFWQCNQGTEPELHYA